MVQHRVLWASEAAGMNDRAEVRQGWKKVKKWLNSQPESEAVELLKHVADRPLAAPHQVFVLCASTRPDDANQWRLYANGGAGYAVQLDPTVALIALTDSEVEPWTSGRVSFGAATSVVEVGPWLHVLYEADDIDAALQALVDRLNASAEAIERSGFSQDEKDGAYDMLQSEAYRDVAEIAHLIKEPGFSGENEVRVVVTFFWGDDHIKHRAGRYGVVGYTELAASSDGKQRIHVVPRTDATAALPIRSVRIGPLLHKEHKASVRGFLRKHGHGSVAVRRSKVPLR